MKTFRIIEPPPDPNSVGRKNKQKPGIVLLETWIIKIDDWEYQDNKQKQLRKQSTFSSVDSVYISEHDCWRYELVIK